MRYFYEDMRNMMKWMEGVLMDLLFLVPFANSLLFSLTEFISYILCLYDTYLITCLFIVRCAFYCFRSMVRRNAQNEAMKDA